MIELYEHNQKAYDAVVSMLAKTGKAAVVHPTGTGKSFIAFKLCEDEPDKTVCWLSPSEYIFRTQLENLKKTSSYEPENIKFYTYAKLMLMSEPELAAIQPDIIVYDEFHCAGAAQWSLGIARLNEGIHVSGVSGVILFRPTVSPIVYKQQIGRALTAGDEATPLILDVVNNVENLMSIGALEEEMGAAVQRMYQNGEGGQVVTERFRVIEQVRDCRELFAALQKSLTGTWEQYFQAASAYYAEHGDLNVPRRYVADGLSLGEWILTQKKVRAGRQLGVLTPRQIERLDGIGMVWENRLETSWERKFAYAEAYFREHGDLLVPTRYVTEDGFRLGQWISNLRVQYLNGEQRTVLNRERIERLNAIGMKWDVPSMRWEQNYIEALRYYQEHGDLNVPVAYLTETGFRLGVWVRSLRYAKQGRHDHRALTGEQVARLDAIGMQWDDCQANQWNRAYSEAESYYRRHGTLDIPSAYKTPAGLALGKWVCRQRYLLKDSEKNPSPGRRSAGRSWIESA